MTTFTRRKDTILAGLQQHDRNDKSPKGSLDAPIMDLIAYVNSCDDFVTTSSCSGRITVFADATDDCKGTWLLIEHERVSPEAMLSAVKSATRSACVRFEPFILCVECANVEAANRLCQIGRDCGFRESGVSIGGGGSSSSSDNNHHRRILASIRSAIRLEVPVVATNGRVLVDDAYIEYLTTIINHKFTLNAKRTQAFFDRLRSSSGNDSDDDADAHDDDGTQWSVCVPRLQVKAYKDALKALGFLDQSVRIVTVEDGDPVTRPMLLPITTRGHRAIQDDPSCLPANLPREQMTMRIIAAPIPTRKGRRAPAPAQATHGGGGGGGGNPINALRRVLPTMVLPRKYEILDDVVLFPASAATKRTLTNANTDEWKAILRAFRVNRVGLQCPVAEGLRRESRVELLHPAVDTTDGWVCHRENGVHYCFDVTKSMFSSGNTTERKRMGLIAKHTETVVDFYAGIGYFTLPFLIHGRVQHVYACEMNEASVEGLRRGLVANKIAADRCTIVVGDNRATQLTNVADRVCLGLLPSSEDGYALALRALRPRGGWIHAHGNTPNGTEREWAANIVETMRRLIVDTPVKCSWSFAVRHIERVKSYAPRVMHVVADIYVCCSGATVDDEQKNTTKSDAVNESPAFTAIDTVMSPSAQDIQRYVDTVRMPLVLRGLDMGVAMQRWTDLEYMIECERDRQVSVHVCSNPRLDFITRNFVFRTMPFEEFMRRCARDATMKDKYFISPNEHYYLREIGRNPRNEVANFSATYPKLAADFQYPPEFPSTTIVSGERFFSSVLRISSPGMQLWTHYDICDNFLCHVRGGRKRVVMFPPSDVRSLYVEGSSSPILQLDEYDDNRWPLYRRAHRYECILEPGDILYIPSLWFHNVTTVVDDDDDDGVCVSVNVFWRHLEDCEYDSKDLYGNKDLKQGQKAIDMAASLRDHIIRNVPGGAQFKDFYLQKATMALINK